MSKSNLGLILLFAAVVIYGLTLLTYVFQDDPQPQFTMDESTTGVKEPLIEDGFVDYLHEVNKRHLEVVTPENNFALALWQALGVDSVPKAERQAFFSQIEFRFDPDSTLPQWKSSEEFLPSYNFDSRRGLRKASSFFQEAPLKSWQGGDAPAIEALLKENEQVLDYLAQEMTRTQFAQPYICRQAPKLLGASLYGVVELKEIGRMFALRAMLHQGSGDLRKAQQDSLSCMRIAQYLTQRSAAIEVQYGFEVYRWSTEVEASILGDPSLSENQLSDHPAAILARRKMPEITKSYNEMDRWMILEIAQLWVQDFNKGTLSPILTQLVPAWAHPLEIDMDISMRAVNEWFDRGVQSLSLDSHDAIISEISNVYRDLEALNGSLTKMPKKTPEALGEHMGKILVTQLYPDMRGFYQASAQAESQQRMVLTAYALRQYLNAHSSYPDNLEALVSETKLTPDLIVDPYTGNPFNFETIDGKPTLKNSPPDQVPWKIELPQLLSPNSSADDESDK